MKVSNTNLEFITTSRSVLLMLLIVCFSIYKGFTQTTVSLGFQTGIAVDENSVYDFLILPTKITFQKQVLRQTELEISLSRVNYNKYFVVDFGVDELINHKANTVSLSAFVYKNLNEDMKVGFVYGTNLKFNSWDEIHGNPTYTDRRYSFEESNGLGFQLGLRFCVRFSKKFKFWSTTNYYKYFIGRSTNQIVVDFNAGYEF